ncbi:hypothetical protein OSB04_008774 [Centaurea solstitialis]|uniref:J domain-containing protein n=1 Tax=Centaurea solstitialis TaxID=347529 RepID=A0AA38WTC7_9ASTR|nr:hypothetical protein OSB04_008774 [Centaurea solstitialis]
MKNLRRCKNDWVPENVVLIDVDSDGFDDVNIDIPENLTKKLQGSNRFKNGKNVPSRTFIFIDDDAEIPDNQHTATNTHFDQENISPVKLSKSKRTYAGRGTDYCYDFSMQPDSDSSETDSLDCEFMVDSSGVLQEQWERAYKMRKTDVQSDHRVMRENNSFLRPFEDGYNYFGVKQNKQSYAEVPSRSDFKEVIHEKDGEGKQKYRIPSDYGASDIADIGPRNFKVNRTSFSVETDDCSHGFGQRDSSEVENEGKFVVNSSNTDEASVENSIVNEREKLKETDEYKRAIEEEWSARRKTLKVQAEEAQKLRRMLKRKKAETLRLLDMERRQKQRLEEIRETRKQDKENMNLKEMYRGEVQRELNKLKTTCHDMASLLRGLGVLTNNDPAASSLHVRAAYKRALLSFHPDRASGLDMRQQVEVEEKFKLISQMKDKML